MYTPKQAARKVGKSKATIHRDITKGKLSASRDEQGNWHIDPSELFRVYEAVTSKTTQDGQRSI